MAWLSRAELLNDLRDRIRRLEDHAPTVDRSRIDLGTPALEDWLPDGRLAAGSLVELLSSADGAGALTLALFMSRHACRQRKVFVVVDHQGRFYPPAAVRLGIDLDRLIVVHPRTPQDAALAVDQSLRTAAVGSVLCWQDRL